MRTLPAYFPGSGAVVHFFGSAGRAVPKCSECCAPRFFAFAYTHRYRHARSGFCFGLLRRIEGGLKSQGRERKIMRPVRPQKTRRPFRHVSPEDLLVLSIMGDGRVRREVEHELDVRTMKRIIAQAQRLSAKYFPDADMPTGGRFSRQNEWL